MIKGGYILQPRSFDRSSASKMPPCAREVWLYILRNVNHADTDKFKRGQGFFVMSEIMEALSWSVGYRKMTYSKTQVAKALRRLCEDSLLTTAKTTRGLIVTVCNYSYYQNPKNYEDYNEESTKTQRRPRGDHTINKNEEERKNDIITPIAPLKGGGEKFDPVAFCVSLGANEQDAIDWVTWRKKGKWKKETTKRVINYLKGRAEKSNISFAMAVNICADRQWLCLTDDFKPTEQESIFAGGWK